MEIIKLLKILWYFQKILPKFRHSDTTRYLEKKKNSEPPKHLAPSNLSQSPSVRLPRKNALAPENAHPYNRSSSPNKESAAMQKGNCPKGRFNEPRVLTFLRHLRTTRVKIAWSGRARRWTQRRAERHKGHVREENEIIVVAHARCAILPRAGFCLLRRRARAHAHVIKLHQADFNCYNYIRARENVLHAGRRKWNARCLPGKRLRRCSFWNNDHNSWAGGWRRIYIHIYEVPWVCGFFVNSIGNQVVMLWFGIVIR